MAVPTLESRPTLWEDPAASGCNAARADEERGAALAGRIALTQACMTVVGALSVALLTPNLTSTISAVLAATGLSFGVGHLLARRGLARAAGIVVVATQLVVPSALVAVYPAGLPVVPMSAAGWLSLSIPTANAILGMRAGLVAGIVSMLSLAAIGLGRRIDPMAVPEAEIFLASLTLAIFYYTRHQARLEAARQAQLQARNTELERIRSTLERRVEDRTREIAARAAELETNQRLLVGSERMAAVGRLTAGFAHELATPLATILATLKDLECLTREYAVSIGDQSVNDDDHRSLNHDMAEAQAALRASADRAATFVRGIRAHTRDPGRKVVETFDAREVVRQATDILSYLARASQVKLELEPSAEPVELRGVPSRLNQAVTNLIQNAIDATAEHRESGTVRLGLACVGGDAVIRVADDGPGIAPDVLERIFEPLFTTKPYGKGTGLGLSIVREVVRDDFGGTIDVETEVGTGTRFVLRIPMQPSEGDSRGT